MIPECFACPFRHWPTRCHASTTGHRRLCQLATELGRRDYLEYVEALTLGRTPPTPSTPTTLNPTLATRAAIEACPHRGPIVTEGCQCQRLCYQGKGSNPDNGPIGRVKEWHCWQCVTKARESLEIASSEIRKPTA